MNERAAAAKEVQDLKEVLQKTEEASKQALLEKEAISQQAQMGFDAKVKELDGIISQQSGLHKLSQSPSPTLPPGSDVVASLAPCPSCLQHFC
mmetsp:Transcript_12517/g.14588  ORF Transcript_12517/g.14588 Transcript_12517/m.14588 type:complete len:93 (-) Transcript_12517:56-334(-)